MPASASARLLAALAVAVLVGAAVGCDEERDIVFTHGVAVGDVGPDGAILWTRVDSETAVTAQVATDQEFRDLVFLQDVGADSERDFTVRSVATGLEPGTTYYYRFRRRDVISDVGTFRTAPAEDEAAAVRFVFSGDSDGTVRDDGTRPFDFRVLDAARAEEPDFFLYFGDTIYADSGYGAKAETLDAFREKYKENREVGPLRRLLSATSIYTVWDDHEVDDNFAGTTVSKDLFTAGLRAFREYMPISGDEDEPEVLYRRFRWGKAVEIIILDERSFRDDDVEEACATEAGGPDLLPGLGAPGVPDAYRALRVAVGLPEETEEDCLAALNDPDRTLLGDAQKAFLLQALEQSDATFKFIVNPVPIAELVAQPYDRWEGYRAERDELLGFIAGSDIHNVIFITTDFHANIISDVRVDLASPPVAVEAITGPIAHATLGQDIAATQGEEVIPVYEQLLKQVARVDCVELDAFSYGLVEVEPETGTATITLKDEDGGELCRTVVEAD